MATMDVSRRLRWRPALSPSTTSLVAAVAAGVVAVLLVHNYIQQVRTSLGGDVPILVAANPLPAGAVLQEADLRTQIVPAKGVHEQVIRASSRYEILGRRTEVELAPSQPVHWNSLQRDHVPHGMATTLGAGQRALTLSVDRVAGVGGFIMPGDHIDIIATFVVPPGFAIAEGGKVVPRSSGRDSQGFVSQKLTKVVMQDVTVLATGERALDAAMGGVSSRSSQSDYSDVTLLLSPTEGEILTFAQEMGNVRFMLRNKETDKGKDTELEPVDVTSVLDVERKATRKSAQGKRFDTEIEMFGSLEGGTR